MITAGIPATAHASAQVRHIYGDLIHTRYTVDEGFEVREPVIMD
jgi:hypothetical protein